MATPFLSEIKIVAFNFAPKGWAFCNGQLLPISQNQALFSLLGTTYGGDGKRTFGLPNLAGRTPIHRSGGHVLGEMAGEQSHTLSISEMPQHHHFLNGVAVNATTANFDGSVFANSANLYTGAANLTTLAPGTIGNTGGSQPHENMQPYLVLNFIIALQGIYPPHN